MQGQSNSKPVILLKPVEFQSLIAMVKALDLCWVVMNVPPAQ